jgi:predicted outer membrane repeat protein
MKKLIRILIIALLVSTPVLLFRVNTAQAVFYTIDVDTTVDDPTKTACTLAANDCSLRGAISLVNAVTSLPTPDYYIMLGPLTYTLTTHGTGEDANASGDLDITYPGTLYIVGDDMFTTIIDGDAADRVIDIHDGTVTPYQLTIRNGDASGLYETGGGINARSNTSLNLLGVLLDLNTSGDAGGGLAALDATVTITSSIIHGNNAERGGGVHVFDTSMNINEVQFFSNTAETSGGGLFTSNSGVIKLNHAVFIDNTAGQGGGIFNTGASVSIESSIIRANTANSGSGLTSYYGSVLMTGTEVSANEAISNATLSFNSGSFTLRNVTVANNTALSNPGITTINFSTPLVGSLDHVTLTGNTTSGGPTTILRIGSGSITLKNTIINSASGSVACELVSAESALTSQGYNIASDLTCHLTEITDQPETDPWLKELGDYGGFSFTTPPSRGSSAIEGADPATTPSYLDQRMFKMVDGDQNGISLADIGASEYLPPVAFLPLVLSP